MTRPDFRWSRLSEAEVEDLRQQLAQERERADKEANASLMAKRVLAAQANVLKAEQARAEKAEAAFEELKTARFETERAAESLTQIVQEWLSVPGRPDQEREAGPNSMAALRSKIRRRLERFLNAPDFLLSPELSAALAQHEKTAERS